MAAPTTRRGAEVGPTSNPNYSAAKVSAGRWFTPAETLPSDGQPRHPERAGTGPLVRVLPEQGERRPAAEPARRLLRELDHRQVPVKLQGVGPRRRTPGSIIDGAAFGGDARSRKDWYARIELIKTTARDISLYLEQRRIVPKLVQRRYRAEHRRLRPPRWRPQVSGRPSPRDRRRATGRGLFTPPRAGPSSANAYARNLQITNNVVQNNGGSYGTDPHRHAGPRDPDKPDTTRRPDREQPDRRERRDQPGRRPRALRRGRRLRGQPQRHLRQLLRRVRRRLRPTATARTASDHNRLWYNRRTTRAAGSWSPVPADPSRMPSRPAAGTTRRPRQRDPAEPRQRRRRRPALPDGLSDYSSNAIYRSCPINVYNNMIVNNVSTHEGGGIAIDDTPNVRAYNNTIMKNVTTATAVTSDGQPARPGCPPPPTAACSRRHDRGRGPLQQPAPVQQHLLGQPGGHTPGRDRDRPRRGRRRDADQRLGPRRRRWLRDPAPTRLGHPAELRRPPLRRERQPDERSGRRRPV